MPATNNVRARKRRKDDDTQRRSRNACKRCKSKKLRCYYGTLNGDRPECVPCTKSNATCEFDVFLDGVPRSAACIAELESKIQALEAELQTSQQRVSELSTREDEGRGCLSTNTGLPSMIFGLVGSARARKSDDLPPMPSMSVGETLFEVTYRYTQARYCIVDWRQAREWHHDRDQILGGTGDDTPSGDIGAYFIWMIYAIGARLASYPEKTYEGYYAQAFRHIQAVLEPQNLVSVQGLLVLIQYNCRVADGPSHWSLVGATMRLCVELGYHRRRALSAIAQKSARELELEKRFFWCAYCYDRMVSIVSQRPFGIHDLDIDIDMPVDIDVDSTDEESIRGLQVQQESNSHPSGTGSITSLTAALSHLRMYRIRSRIYQRFTGPYALAATFEDVRTFLEELDDWKHQALRTQTFGLPHQGNDRTSSMYLQTVLLLFRPILARQDPEPSLVSWCANLAAEACENAKHISINLKSPSSPVMVSNCFYCGITLLQCLMIDPTCLPLKQTLRAINACSSALAVNSKTVFASTSFLQLFDLLSDRCIGTNGDSIRLNSDPALRDLLTTIISSDRAQISEIAASLSQAETGESTSTFDHGDEIDPFLADLGHSEIDFGSFMGMDDFTLPNEMLAGDAQYNISELSMGQQG